MARTAKAQAAPGTTGWDVAKQIKTIRHAGTEKRRGSEKGIFQQKTPFTLPGNPPSDEAYGALPDSRTVSFATFIEYTRAQRFLFTGEKRLFPGIPWDVRRGSSAITHFRPGWRTARSLRAFELSASDRSDRGTIRWTITEAGAARRGRRRSSAVAAHQGRDRSGRRSGRSHWH